MTQTAAPDRAIVIFHGIGRPGRALEPGEARFWLDRDRFRAILDRIAAMGAQAPAITFDDGNASDIAIAAPELAARGLRATFFLLTGRLNTPGALCAADVTALARAGHRIGLHGHAHCDWRRLDDRARRREYQTARGILAKLAGAPVTEAAAPFGLYDRRVAADLAALGFAALHTSDRGRARRGAFLQPRNCIEAGMEPPALERALWGHVPLARRPRRLLGLARKRLWPPAARRPEPAPSGGDAR